MKIIINEKQYKTILKESYYDSDRLYSKQYIENVTKDANRDIRNIVRSLEVIGCNDSKGNLTHCVRVPEVLFVYISGRY
tara:strand:- start:1467 stop:1703 length:237 start_codon:yes stop_codon:yes gene_type:complete